MVNAMLRLNFIQPGLDPSRCRPATRPGSRWRSFAEDNGFMAVTFEEHHGADNGWSPARS